VIDARFLPGAAAGMEEAAPNRFTDSFDSAGE
jgi:hypothetical protein